jgi:hypothetical protein
MNDREGTMRGLNHLRTWPLLLGSVLVIAAGCGSARDDERSYERAVASLAADNGVETAQSGFETLALAETKAFPVLIAHVHDSTRAAFSLQGDRIGDPTVGSVCFQILQTEVEGEFPKSLLDYHILTSAYVRQWWEQHKTKSLPEIRLESAQMSLDMAKKDYAKDKLKSTEYAVKFLTEHLKEVQDELKHKGPDEH